MWMNKLSWKLASIAMMGAFGVSFRIGNNIGRKSFFLNNRKMASKTKLNLYKEVSHPAFEIMNHDLVEEYGVDCTVYRHKKSKTELLSVRCEDDNKVFGITLRTPPDDSSGLPHILEHSVLCGSRKFLTKDPFVHLLKGSLQTFLNAFTYPDRTCYVVASQNEKDFNNLVNVYTDAVFFPRAVKDPMVLAQEGWHLELENEQDSLTYKGVVFNEMKGVYSQPESIMNRASQRSLFPDNTYGVDSGGDPKRIPDLTFDKFVNFHETLYHPSNARIFFYGDDDVFNRLELMDSYLNEFNEKKMNSEIEWQKKKYTEVKRVTQKYPSQEDKHFLMVNWLLNDRPLTPYEELTLVVLNHLLTGTTSSVLRKSLMESGLGEALIGGGVSDELLQATFSIGMKGIKENEVEKLEKLIFDTFANITEFSNEDVAASLNTIEFQLREFNTGSFPKGLSLMLGSMSKWIYGESPTSALKFEEPLKLLKSNLKKHRSQVFVNFMNEFIVENDHVSIVELVPSKTLEKEVLQEEKTKLSDIKSKLTSAELNSVISKTKELKKLQAAEDSTEVRATIPSLQLEDLKRETTEYPISVEENENKSGVTVVRHELLQATSGIAYINFLLDLSEVKLDEAPLLSLVAQLMTETGAGEYDSVALSQQIGTYTGGVSVGILKNPIYIEGQDESTCRSGDCFTAYLQIRGKATTDNFDKLFDLFQLILSHARFDSQAKVIELLKESKSGLESSIQGSGHAMSNSRMKARYLASAYVDEIMGGISYLDTLKSLLKQAEEDWPTLLGRLEAIRDKIKSSKKIVDITGDEKVLSHVKPNLHSFLGALPPVIADSSNNSNTNIHPWAKEAKERMKHSMPIQDEGFIVPTQVSYVGKGGLLYEPEKETISGSAAVVANFLKTGYLWDRVRVMGGAYGGFCTFSPYTGFLSFLSYRDPNFLETLSVYDQAFEALNTAAEDMQHNPDILQTAIIGTIGDMDGALSPDQKGYKSLLRYLSNQSPEYRQKYRDQVLNTQPSDFKDFSHRLKHLKNPSVAVVSSEAKLKEAIEDDRNIILTEIF